jgi:ABC-2 type transport system permease protein
MSAATGAGRRTGATPPTEVFPAGTFTADPARGRLGRMLAAQSGVEIRLALRNGEQVLLTLLIPLALLVGLTLIPVVPLPAPRVASVTPAVLALAVLSTAFTSQAISLGFDRRYGVIRRLAATAIPRWLLVAGRLVAVYGVVAVQLVVLGAVAFALGWRPSGAGLVWGLPLVALGTAAFAALGILLGGTLRAEIVLAVANIVWFALLLGGGIVVPAAQLPGPLGAVVPWLPSGALAEGLRVALVEGRFPGAHPLLVLLGWAVVASAVAARTVRLR